MPMSDAKQRILLAVHAIGAGQVASYGEVARRAGLPGRARWVAKLLAQADDASLPWHRVIRSDGRIAFAEGSAEFAEQVQRLRAEGVPVRNGRVSQALLAKRPSLDALLWGHDAPLS